MGDALDYLSSSGAAGGASAPPPPVVEERKELDEATKARIEAQDNWLRNFKGVQSIGGYDYSNTPYFSIPNSIWLYIYRAGSKIIPGLKSLQLFNQDIQFANANYKKAMRAFKLKDPDINMYLPVIITYFCNNYDHI